MGVQREAAPTALDFRRIAPCSADASAWLLQVLKQRLKWWLVQEMTMATSDTSKRKTAQPTAASDPFTPPAQQVWLAGLGALAKAQEQGSKAMEALLNDGLAFQRKSQAEAQQRLQEATERLSHMASDLGQQATGRVDKLEHLFEDRVAKALHRLGMPSLLDIQMLTERVAQLEAQLAALQSKPSPAAAKKPRSRSA
jgi:poly(hydroxyalkanoate) granule-associated protein